MRTIDRLTTERQNIPSITLMDSASAACLDAIRARLDSRISGRRVLLLCGKGNNGGDGAGLARMLVAEGAECVVVLFGKSAETRGDAGTNFERLAGLEPLKLIECDNASAWA